MKSNTAENIVPEWQRPYQILPSSQCWDETKDWCLEIGPGNGKFLLWVAEQNPQNLYIAVEIRNMRFQNVAEKAKAKGLKNLIAIHGDARYCLPHLLRPRCLAEAFILFPDPWPKRRHNKHRLLNRERTDQIYDFLKPKGRIWIATDHDHYSEQIRSVFPNDRWEAQEGISLYPTYFETKWKKLGREIFYFCFGKLK